MVKYNDRYLRRKYRRWATIELKLWLEELQQKDKAGTITQEETLSLSSVSQEIGRRLRERQLSLGY